MLGALRSAKKAITGQAEAEGRMLAMASETVMSDVLDGPVPMEVLDEHLRAYVGAENQLTSAERQRLLEDLRQSPDPALGRSAVVLLICRALAMTRLSDNLHSGVDSAQQLAMLLPDSCWLNDVGCKECDTRSIVILAMPHGRCPECEARSLLAAS